MKLKICGLKFIRDLEFLSMMKLDYAGINFCKTSSMYHENGDIVTYLHNFQQNHTTLVAIFENQPQSEVSEILAKNSCFYVVQFSGDESPDFIKNFKATHPEIKKVWKTVNITNYKEYIEICDLLIFENIHLSIDECINDIETSAQYGISSKTSYNDILDIKNRYNNSYLLDIECKVIASDEFDGEGAIDIVELWRKNK